jgi:hypothetical protein
VWSLVFLPLSDLGLHWCAKPGDQDHLLPVQNTTFQFSQALYFQFVRSSYFQFVQSSYLSVRESFPFILQLPPRFVKFPLSVKISVYRQHHRHSYLDRAARRREFTDEDFAELLTYEELVRLRVPVPIPEPVPAPIPEPAPVTMAARIIPAVSCPLPTFSGSKKEDLSMFIEAIEIAHQEKRALYDTDEIALRAKKSLLMQACKSKAARYIKGLDQDKKDTWDHLVAALTEKYNAPNAEDRAKAYSKAMKLKQKSDEELGTYAKRAKKLAKKIDPALDRVLATHFTHGIRSRRLREMVVATSQNKADFTFKEVYESVRAIARSRRSESGSDSDSDSDSDSSSSSSTDSSAGGGSVTGASKAAVSLSCATGARENFADARVRNGDRVKGRDRESRRARESRVKKRKLSDENARFF